MLDLITMREIHAEPINRSAIMPKNMLSQKAIELVTANDGSFGKAKARLQELLQPKNSEMSVKKVKWQPCKGDW